jgi:biopolymer transport protein TolR
MAMPAGTGSGGRGRRRSRGSRRVMSEINVTPLVDVMLVLLIVFMVAAPLMTAGVPIDLPQASVQPLAVDKEPIMVTVDTDGRSSSARRGALGAARRADRCDRTNGLDERIYVRGDRTASYGAIRR